MLFGCGCSLPRVNGVLWLFNKQLRFVSRLHMTYHELYFLQQQDSINFPVVSWFLWSTNKNVEKIECAQATSLKPFFALRCLNFQKTIEKKSRHNELKKQTKKRKHTHTQKKKQPNNKTNHAQVLIAVGWLIVNLLFLGHGQAPSRRK